MSLFLAARAVGSVREKLGIRKTNRLAPVLRWVGLGVAGLVAVLAVLSFFLPTNNVLIWGGIYGAIAAVIVGIMQSNLTFVNRIMGFLLEVFYWRCIIYIVLSIPCFFHVVLIVGGIMLDLLAIAYFIAACFFKEREYYDAATIAQEEQRANAKSTLETNTQPAPKIDL